MGKVHIGSKITTCPMARSYTMQKFTAQELDAIEADAIKAGRTIRPREREAGRNFLMMDPQTRTYGDVAQTLTKSDGTHPQEGRTAVYVRTYLTFVDKLNEGPSRGRKSNGNGSKVTFKETGNIVLDTNLS